MYSGGRKMKKIYIINCWLMIASWCLFLNGLQLPACLLGLICSCYLLMSKSEVDIWRTAAVTLGMFILALTVLLSCNITYFFPKLTFFIPIVCLNAAIANEYLYMLNKRFVLLITIFAIISISVLSIIIVIVPDELYSLFTKRNLFMMAFLIFLPYLLPMLLSYVFRTIPKKLSAHIAKQRATQ